MADDAAQPAELAELMRHPDDLAHAVAVVRSLVAAGFLAGADVQAVERALHAAAPGSADAPST